MYEEAQVNSSDNESQQHAHVVSLFALVGMSITAIMGLVGLFNNNVFLAASLLFASFVYFLGYLAYKKYNNIALSSAIILYSLYLLMFYLIYSGGVENTGPLWIFIVAPVSVFIHGLKRGLIDIALFVAIISTLMFMPTDIIAHANYSYEFKLRLLFSF